MSYDLLRECIQDFVSKVEPTIPKIQKQRCWIKLCSFNGEFLVVQKTKRNSITDVLQNTETRRKTRQSLSMLKTSEEAQVLLNSLNNDQNHENGKNSLLENNQNDKLLTKMLISKANENIELRSNLDQLIDFYENSDLTANEFFEQNKEVISHLDEEIYGDPSDNLKANNQYLRKRSCSPSFDKKPETDLPDELILTKEESQQSPSRVNLHIQNTEIIRHDVSPVRKVNTVSFNGLLSGVIVPRVFENLKTESDLPFKNKQNAIQFTAKRPVASQAVNKSFNLSSKKHENGLNKSVGLFVKDDEPETVETLRKSTLAKLLNKRLTSSFHFADKIISREKSFMFTINLIAKLTTKNSKYFFILFKQMKSPKIKNYTNKLYILLDLLIIKQKKLSFEKLKNLRIERKPEIETCSPSLNQNIKKQNSQISTSTKHETWDSKMNFNEFQRVRNASPSPIRKLERKTNEKYEKKELQSPKSNAITKLQKNLDTFDILKKNAEIKHTQIPKKLKKSTDFSETPLLFNSAINCEDLYPKSDRFCAIPFQYADNFTVEPPQKSKLAQKNDQFLAEFKKSDSFEKSEEDEFDFPLTEDLYELVQEKLILETGLFANEAKKQLSTSPHFNDRYNHKNSKRNFSRKSLEIEGSFRKTSTDVFKLDSDLCVLFDIIKKIDNKNNEHLKYFAWQELTFQKNFIGKTFKFGLIYADLIINLNLKSKKIAFNEILIKRKANKSKNYNKFLECMGISRESYHNSSLNRQKINLNLKEDQMNQIIEELSLKYTEKLKTEKTKLNLA